MRIIFFFNSIFELVVVKGCSYKFFPIFLNTQKKEFAKKEFGMWKFSKIPIFWQNFENYFCGRVKRCSRFCAQNNPLSIPQYNISILVFWISHDWSKILHTWIHQIIRKYFRFFNSLRVFIASCEKSTW